MRAYTSANRARRITINDFLCGCSLLKHCNDGIRRSIELDGRSHDSQASGLGNAIALLVSCVNSSATILSARASTGPYSVHAASRSSLPFGQNLVAPANLLRRLCLGGSQHP